VINLANAGTIKSNNSPFPRPKGWKIPPVRLFRLFAFSAFRRPPGYSFFV
jgi:hypothetical protein